MKREPKNMTSKDKLELQKLVHKNQEKLSNQKHTIQRQVRIFETCAQISRNR